MNKSEYIQAIKAKWEEYYEAKRHAQKAYRELEKIAASYAGEHVPETGLHVGQKVTVKNPFDGKDTPAWFAGAEASYVHPDGNLTLRFHSAKKDGTPTKRTNPALTQNFIVKEE